MTWSIGDVGRINPDCPEDLREMWVRIARDTFKRCRMHGGEDCEAKAITRADKAVAVFIKAKGGRRGRTKL